MKGSRCVVCERVHPNCNGGMILLSHHPANTLYGSTILFIAPENDSFAGLPNASHLNDFPNACVSGPEMEPLVVVGDLLNPEFALQL